MPTEPEAFLPEASLGSGHMHKIRQRRTPILNTYLNCLTNRLMYSIRTYKSTSTGQKLGIQSIENMHDWIVFDGYINKIKILGVESATRKTETPVISDQ